MTTPLERKHLRWPRRIALALLAGVAMTVGSAWILQWRGFEASRQVKWVQGPFTTRVSWFRSPHAYYDSGDGIRLYNEKFSYALQNHPAPQHSVHKPEEIPWILTAADYGDRRTWHAARHYWDSRSPIEGYNNGEERVHIQPTRGNSFTNANRHAYFRTGTPPSWLNAARSMVPGRAEHAILDPKEALNGRPFHDEAFGWQCASAFLSLERSSERTEDLHVERWSAQRVGWPFHALMTEQYAIGPRPPIELVADMPFASLRHGIRGGLILHRLPQHPLLHPLGHYNIAIMPVWPGFLYNTLLSASAVGLLWFTCAFSAQHFGRTQRRLKRGLCQHCGYDTQGLDSCPECGAKRGT